MAHDALGAHARDELGISPAFIARPIQAGLASAGSFALGAALPLLVTSLAPASGLISLVAGTSLVFLALLGGVAARTGGARIMTGAIRVAFWGAMAMAVTAASEPYSERLLNGPLRAIRFHSEELICTNNIDRRPVARPRGTRPSHCGRT